MAYTDIDDPTIYFNTIAYTGDGSQDVTGVGFQPDWVWVKARGYTYNHQLHDSVRGATAGMLSSNQTIAEDSNYHFDSFDSDGFTTDSSNITGVNGNTHGQVAWNWLAGGSASSNSDGSITSSVSANTTAGFSIVSWSGSGANAQIGHGLGAEPKMIFLKIRTGTNNWQVYNKSIGSGNALFLNTTDASGSNTGWQSTDATSSVFYVSGGTAVNGSGQNLIAYCFAEKKGYSKIGSYTGNGSNSGTYIYLGFKPALFIIKALASGENWRIFDNKRSTSGFNPIGNSLRPNSTDAEVTGTDQEIDFLSNGVKLRTTSGEINPSGTTFVFMAFAESPFVNSNGVPNNGR